MMRSLVTALLAGVAMTAFLAATAPAPSFGGRWLGDYPPVPLASLQQIPSAPDRKPLPAHTYGPHHNEPHAFCSRQKTFTHNGDTYYECHCDFVCETGAGGEKLQREADNCVTACGEDQCLCHECESCDQPPPGAPR